MKKPFVFVKPYNTSSVSLTGQACSLECRHCGRHFLKNMVTIDKIPEKGMGKFKSLLISGGLDEDLQVPVLKYKKKIIELKENGYKINLHLGFFDKSMVSEIKDLADVVSLDIVGSDRVIEKVYGVKKSVSFIFDLLKELKENELKTVVHITAGLEEGNIKSEFRAVDLLSGYYPDKVVFNVLIPVKGTFYENVLPPSLFEVKALFEYSRKMLGDTDFFLGCMIPGGKYRENLQFLVVEQGFSSIVQPVKKVEDFVIKKGEEVLYSYECCAF